MNSYLQFLQKKHVNEVIMEKLQGEVVSMHLMVIDHLLYGWTMLYGKNLLLGTWLIFYHVSGFKE